MLMLKLQYFGHLIWRADSRKRLWCWEKLRTGGKGSDRGWMVEWYHQLTRCEFEQTQGDSEGQGNLECYSPWGQKELDTTKSLNNNQTHTSKHELRLKDPKVCKEVINKSQWTYYCKILVTSTPWKGKKYEKAKRYDTKRWTPQVSKCSLCYWRVEK